MSVELPSKIGEAYVYLAHDEVITDPLPIEVNQSKTPLLGTEKRSISAGETITLIGENFNEQTVVHFNNVTVNSIYIDEKTIKVKTPRQLSGWRYWVSNQFGKSNTVSFSIE
ncbi:IPT/TIG domain-containing protein [Pseudoalteromonas sp. SWXJ133]|uniref:IPT/TIG domain-containing protein n=1 Tax=Pseudoalteromonas sp. SWXJ133 TaxID=2792069 RepID=UPI0018CF87B2|nr:IPT/TIG domain-containing protein [Pseudoalteromonas sp. SWXJ133]MBH0020528.1 IPT/TIG domain-containing protein [Pseudoalteromonas sp. SWXJ133]